MSEITVDAVRVKWDVDEFPDLSWLETELSEDGKTIISSCRYDQKDLDEHPIRIRRYIKQDYRRLNSYGDSWIMMGCVAEAEVKYKIGNTENYRVEVLSSGGLWGIESDSDDDHKTSIAWQELDDLKAHLEKFGVSIPEDWSNIMQEVITKMHNTEIRRDGVLSSWVTLT